MHNIEQCFYISEWADVRRGCDKRERHGGFFLQRYTHRVYTLSHSSLAKVDTQKKNVLHITFPFCLLTFANPMGNYVLQPSYYQVIMCCNPHIIRVGKHFKIHKN